MKGVNLMQKVEFEYEKILSSVGVNKSIVDHPQFRESFMREYRNLSSDGKFNVYVSFDEERVNLSVEQNLPNETNGVYQGYKSFERCSFSVEKKWDDDYFVVRKKSCGIYSQINKGDNVVCTDTLDVYFRNEQVGKMEYTSSNQYNSKMDLSVYTQTPELMVGFAINGMAPPLLSHYSGNVRCSSSGRMPGSAIVRNSLYSCIDGEYSQRSGYSCLNLEKPYELNFTTNFFAELDGMGGFLYIDPNYSSFGEAVNIIQLKYDESIKSRSI